jgi:hypothetical protein
VVFFVAVGVLWGGGGGGVGGGGGGGGSALGHGDLLSAYVRTQLLARAAAGNIVRLDTKKRGLMQWPLSVCPRRLLSKRGSAVSLRLHLCVLPGLWRMGCCPTHRATTSR